MTSNSYFNSGGGSTSNLDLSSNKQNSPSSSNFNANQLGNQLINGTNFTNNNFQLSNYSALNLNLNSNTGSPSNSINSPINSNGPSLLNNLQSPSRHQQNFLNFNNPALNSQMNNNILNSTVSRPQHLNQQLMSTDPTFTALDPTDFPVLHRSSHSPFQLQTQQLQQLQQQLRNSSYQNAPSSAPILNSASTQNLILQFANQMSASNNNLSNSANATSMLMMMNNNSANNLAQLSTNYLLHHHNSTNQVGSGKMWSNFNPSKDFRLKSQQSGLDNHHQEFNIQQEDFPALPRPQSVHNKSESQPNLNINSTDQNLKTSSTNLSDSNLNSPTGLVNSSSSTSLTNKPLNINQNITNTQHIQNQAQQQTAPSLANTTTTGKKGIIISPDGRIKNVPPNMLLDQFGIVGLLAYLRSADRDKDNYTLALGTDLTALGLNLNSNENLYHSFLSPFSDSPCRLQDIDFPVPTEYIINFQIKDKLAPIDLTRYHEDTLFYLFYMNGGDLIQLQAAGALFDHDWRYHTEKRVWLTKVPGLEPHQKDGLFERGIYTLFDVSQWRKVQMEMSIEYSKLAEKPQLSQILLQQQQLAQSSNPSNSNLPSFLQQQLQHQAFSAANLNPNSLSSLAVNPNQTRSY